MERQSVGIPAEVINLVSDSSAGSGSDSDEASSPSQSNSGFLSTEAVCSGRRGRFSRSLRRSKRLVVVAARVRSHGRQLVPVAEREAAYASQQ